MRGSAPIWIGLAVAAFVFLDLLFVELRRAVREAQRIAKRVVAYKDLPVIGQVAVAQTDIARITGAVDAVRALVARAQLAIAVIKTPALWRDPPPDYLPKGSSPG